MTQEKEYIIQELTKHWFSSTAALVYVFLLHIWEVSASTLARHTTLSRLTAYNNLKILIERWLAYTFTKNKIQQFGAYPVEKFFQIEQNKHESSLKSLNMLTPLLQNLWNNITKNQIEHLKWWDALQWLYEIMLTSPTIYNLIWTSENKSKQHIQYVYEYYLPERMKRSIVTQTLLSPIAYQRFSTYLQQYTHIAKHESFALLESDSWHCDYSLTLFSTNAVVLINDDSNDHSAIYIQDNALYNLFKSIYDTLWEKSKIENFS